MNNLGRDPFTVKWCKTVPEQAGPGESRSMYCLIGIVGCTETESDADTILGYDLIKVVALLIATEIYLSSNEKYILTTSHHHINGTSQY